MTHDTTQAVELAEAERRKWLNNLIRAAEAFRVTMVTHGHCVGRGEIDRLRDLETALITPETGGVMSEDAIKKKITLLKRVKAEIASDGPDGNELLREVCTIGLDFAAALRRQPSGLVMSEEERVFIDDTRKLGFQGEHTIAKLLRIFDRLTGTGKDKTP